MNYFLPTSFIHWGHGSQRNQRVGHFKIDPCNDQYNGELYWCFSTMKEGKYQTHVMHYGICVFKSPLLNCEEQAIRWIEKNLIELVRVKIEASNEKLAATIVENNRYVESLQKNYNEENT